MQYLGDFAADTAQVDFSFNTRKADGTPVALDGGLLAVYKDDATTALGLSAECDLVAVATGQYNVRVYITQEATPLVAGSDYKVVLYAGTVDGTSVAGTVLAQFSIENRYTAPDGTTAAQLAAIRAKTDLIGTGTITVTSPVTAAGGVTIIQGDTYSASEVAWTDSGSTWPADLDTATSILCCIGDEVELDCTYAAGVITLDALSCVETAALAAGQYPYWLEAQWDGDPDTIKTICKGTFNIRPERPEVTA